MIRVGLIGAGFIGRNHYNQYEKLSDRAAVVALCDKEADRRAGDWSKVGGNVGDMQGTKRDLGDIKPYTDWHELIADADVDVVDICVPTHLHPEMTIAALKAGKHVLCEKPMALNVQQCDRMLAAAAGAQGKFMIAQVVRFWPENVYLKQAFNDQRFGLLRALQLRRQASMPDYTLNNWALNPDLAGGAILDLHVHDVDFSLWLLGKPKRIYAQGYSQSTGGIDRVHALWHYDPNTVVQLEAFWDMPPGFGFNMGFTARFDEAAIDWDYKTGNPLTIYKPGSEPETPEIPTEEGYFAEIEYFISCIERGKSPKTSTPQESRDAVALALLEKQSILTGELVSVSSISS